MAANTPKYGFHYPTATDATNIPGDLQTTFDEIDANIVMEFSGTLSTRPGAAIFGRRYYASDVGKEYFDTGVAWIAVGPINVATGNIVGSAAGDSGLAGGTGFSADAGHKHPREPIGQASDIQPTGSVAVGGSTGKWTDAGHVHPGDCIGDIKASVTGITSIGWQVANGVAVSRVTYATFYNACGGSSAYPWGQGDGSTTFNLPDFRDQVLIGAGNLYSVGQKVGSNFSQIQVANLPSHAHTLNAVSLTSTVSQTPHAHTTDQFGDSSKPAFYGIGSGGANFQTGGSGQYFQAPGSLGGSANANISITTKLTGTTDGTGGAVPLAVVQPSASIIYLIKVA